MQNRVKRCVNGHMKKIVAAEQRWMCAHCNNLLPASFEVDHKLALIFGGTNDRENLAALCPNCHSIKTLHEQNHQLVLQTHTFEPTPCLFCKKLILNKKTKHQKYHLEPLKFGEK